MRLRMSFKVKYISAVMIAFGIFILACVLTTELVKKYSFIDPRVYENIRLYCPDSTDRLDKFLYNS